MSIESGEAVHNLGNGSKGPADHARKSSLKRRGLHQTQLLGLPCAHCRVHFLAEVAAPRSGRKRCAQAHLS
jgi:hypothetical protein